LPLEHLLDNIMHVGSGIQSPTYKNLHQLLNQNNWYVDRLNISYYPGNDLFQIEEAG